MRRTRGARRPNPVWFLSAVLAALAAGGQLWVPLRAAPVIGHPHVPWLALAIGYAAAESCVIHVRLGKDTRAFALGEIPFVLGLLLVSPGALLLARIAGQVGAMLWQRRTTPTKLAFNLAMWWLQTVLAVAAWRFVAVRVSPLSSPGAALLVAIMVLIGITSTACITLAMRLNGTATRLGEFTGTLATDALITTANACFALVAFDVLRVDWHGAWALLVVLSALALGQRAHVALAHRHDSLQRLQQLSREVGAADTVDGVARRILSEARELVGARAATLSLAGSFTGQPAVYTNGEATGDHLEVALYGDGDTIGTLRVAGRLADVGGLGRVELRLLQSLGGHASIALQNARHLDRLREQISENAHQATHDALTALPNRLHFDRSVTDAAATGVPFAVLLLDIDRFREVNDTLGHGAGDRLLTEVGTRLCNQLPEGALVARLGGDEFAVLLSGATREDAVARAKEVRDALLEPLPLGDDLTFSVDASVGVVLAPAHGSDGQQLLRRADVAMYTAKDTHSGVAVYDPATDQHTSDDLALVTDLRRAIGCGGLALQYQPKVTLDDRTLSGVEALVRWPHPRLGVIPPDRFLPMAERIGLMGALTTWVLRTALAQCREWMDDGLQIGVAVNISPRSLRDRDFTARVRELLREAQVPAPQLTLEITEDAIMEDPERALEILWQLRRLGVRLSVDDFGVGHASLSYLQKLPVDEVKIDKSFVLGMLAEPDHETIVSGAIDLVHRLRRKVIAEGVEDERTFGRLAQLGADLAQGYWMSRPLDAGDLPGWLLGWRARGGRAAGLLRDAQAS